MKKLRAKKLSINKQPGVCVKPSLDTFNVQGNMFNENAEASQVTRNASSKSNASGFPSSYFLRTSTDVVTLFFSIQTFWKGGISKEVGSHGGRYVGTESFGFFL